jgi:hypothetical protein
LRAPSELLVGDLETFASRALSGSSMSLDRTKRLEGPRAVSDSRSPSDAGVYPIFISDAEVRTSSSFPLELARVVRLPEVVETRRLELLTLSLQRRCSSS